MMHSAGHFLGKRMGRLTTLKPGVATLGSRVASVGQALGTDGQARRQSANDRGYDYRWQQYRKAWLREHPLCGDRLDGPNSEHSECRREGRVTVATDVDHIKRVNGQQDDLLFWDPANHQSLCHSCHSVKTQAESTGSAP